MNTLLDYFQNDFIKNLKQTRIVPMSFTSKTTGIINKVEINQSIRYDSDNSVSMFTYYIPQTAKTFSIIEYLVLNLNNAKEQAKELQTTSHFVSDILFGSENTTYANKIYFYTENDLSDIEHAQAEELAIFSNLNIIIRGQAYLKMKSKLASPVAFISHDSRDKEMIARPIAIGLSSRMCPVWYDEFSLKPGDSLKQSIEKGIKESKKCIIIFTKNYFDNEGWGKKEYDSIYLREIIKNENVIIPIWFGVTPAEIYEFSPALTDKVALIWPDSEVIEESYDKEVELIISKLHIILSDL